LNQPDQRFDARVTVVGDAAGVFWFESLDGDLAGLQVTDVRLANKHPCSSAPAKNFRQSFVAAQKVSTTVTNIGTIKKRARVAIGEMP
jgi:hypothetical protein